MSVAVQSLLEQALALSPADRALVAETLLSSLAPSDPRADELWAKEAEDRIAAVRVGELETIPAEAVFAELKRERNTS